MELNPEHRDVDREKDDVKKDVIMAVADTLEKLGMDMSQYEFSVKKKSSPKPPPNIQLFQTAAYLAATTLTPGANKIFMYFLSLAPFGNYVGVDQRSISENIGMSLSSVEKGVKELEDYGVILKTKNPADKRRIDYFINPMGAWKGRMLDRKIALHALDKVDPDQLHLFGESLEANQERETTEIKHKRQNLFLTAGQPKGRKI